MKKVLALVLGMLLALSLCACGAKEEVKEEIEDVKEDVGLANPVTEYASLQEVNDLLGCRLTHPGVMGVTEEEFAVINGETPIGEYGFEVNGVDYTFRFSSSFDHDISGVYVGSGTAFSDDYSGEIEYAEADESKLARWFNVDGQYCLCAEDEGKMTMEQFKEIALEMQELTNPALTGDALAAYCEALVGEYQDSVSQRAMATVSLNDNGGLLIEVSWGSSASETSKWTMNATLGEDGLLNYTDCTSTVHTFAEDGSETIDILYTDGAGFFSETEGVLCWNGAADENCQSCTFEKMQ